MKVQCIPGNTRASVIAVSLRAIPESAFKKAKADGPNDHACMLLRMHMPDRNDIPGAMLTVDAAESLAHGILRAVAGLRKEDASELVDLEGCH